MDWSEISESKSGEMITEFKIGDKAYIYLSKEDYPSWGYDRFQVCEITSFDNPRIGIDICSEILDYLPKTLDEYNVIPKVCKPNFTVERHLTKLEF